MIRPTATFNGMNITLCTTYDCNLRCIYCYERRKRHVEIDLKTAFKFIDRILEDDDPIGAEGTSDAWITKTGLVIDFIGGDSFMQPHIIDKVLTYFQYKATLMGHRYANNWRASISSNGTLFMHPEVQKVIEKWGENLSIGVSVDGCPAIHDKYRIFAHPDENNNPQGSMSTIMDWWGWLGERQPDATNHTKSTCSKESIPYLYESLIFMHEILGMTYINQNFIMEATGCEEPDYVLLDEMYRKCADYLFEHRHEMYWSMYDRQGLNKRSDNLTDFNSAIQKGWCGSGAMPTVGMTGKIYPCFRWLPHTQLDAESQADPMSVGNVDEGFTHKENFRRVKEATRVKISSPYCMECEYEGACAYCIGGCYAENHAFRRTEHICTIAKLRAKHARRYWDMVEEAEHNHDDYFDKTGCCHFERIDEVTIDYVRSQKRYGNDGKLKPGIEPTPEEIKRNEAVQRLLREQWRKNERRNAQMTAKEKQDFIEEFVRCGEDDDLGGEFQHIKEKLTKTGVEKEVTRLSNQTKNLKTADDIKAKMEREQERVEERLGRRGLVGAHSRPGEEHAKVYISEKEKTRRTISNMEKNVSKVATPDDVVEALGRETTKFTPVKSSCSHGGSCSSCEKYACGESKIKKEMDDYMTEQEKYNEALTESLSGLSKEELIEKAKSDKKD